MTRRVLQDKSRSLKSMPRRRGGNPENRRTRSEEMDVDVPQAETPRPVTARRKMYNFFCNDKFYRFFRLYQASRYSRVDFAAILTSLVRLHTTVCLS